MDNYDEKFPGASDFRCQECGRWMRSRGSIQTNMFYREELICRFCGVHESIELTNEEYEDYIKALGRMEKERSMNKVQLGARRVSQESENLGQKVFGKSHARATRARRIRKDN